MNRSIAIDGPCGAGKSTIAKQVAKKLGGYYLDTGAMYRTVGLYMLQNGINLDDADAVAENAPKAQVDVCYNEKGEQHVLLCGEDVTALIRTPEVSTAASKVGAVGTVRRLMVKRQQELVKQFFLVCDGRDIGCVVIPDSILKIYLTAKAEVRAKRRMAEAQYQGMSFEEVLKDVNDRDYRDMHREESPLTQAADAVVVDTSRMDIDEVVACIVKLYRKRAECGSFKRVLAPIEKVILKVFHRFRVVNAENLPKEGAYILALNHTCMLDPVLTCPITPLRSVFMAKKELFENKLIARFMTAMNAFPVDRDNNDMAAVRNAIDYLKMGRPLIIFPEGHRYRDGKIHEFKQGVALIAMQAGVPVIPGRIKGRYIPFYGLTLTLGKPMQIEKKRGAGVLQENTEKLWNAVNEL